MSEPVMVPECPACGDPLGLYYAQCLNCYAHRGDYSFADYAHVEPSIDRSTR